MVIDMVKKPCCFVFCDKREEVDERASQDIAEAASLQTPSESSISHPEDLAEDSGFVSRVEIERSLILEEVRRSGDLGHSTYE